MLFPQFTLPTHRCFLHPWLGQSHLDQWYSLSTLSPFPKRQILDSPNLKEFADDNFEVDENGGKFSERAENAVGKGEIARYEQFLLFPQSFQKTCTVDT